MVHSESHMQHHAAFALSDIHCTGCAGAVEHARRANPQITDVRFDWAQNVVYVGFHTGMISLPEIEALIAETGCTCGPAAGTEPATHDHTDPTEPSTTRRFRRLRHAVDVQPITVGTKHDRMQREAPSRHTDQLPRVATGR